MHDQSDFKSSEYRMLLKSREKGIPINGSIELLPYCNMNCDMCYVRLTKEETTAKGRVRTGEEWLSLAQDMKKAGVLFLLLTGGEPLLFPDFKNLYQEIGRMGMYITINTNGTLIEEDWADFFAEYKPRRMNITLYGTSDETYEQLCHYKSGFTKTVNAIRLLRDRNVDVKIGCSVTKVNLNDIERIYKIGEELNAPVVLDSYMMTAKRERGISHAQETRLEPEIAAKVDLIQLWHEMPPKNFAAMVQNALTLYRSNDWNAFADQAPKGLSCMAGGCSFAINWNGNMKPCVITPQPEINVFEHGFENSWQMIHNYCSRLARCEKCLRCPVQHLCPSCQVAELVEEGSYGQAPEYLCRLAHEKLRLMESMEKSGIYEPIF